MSTKCIVNLAVNTAVFWKCTNSLWLIKGNFTGQPNPGVWLSLLSIVKMLQTCVLLILSLLGSQLSVLVCSFVKIFFSYCHSEFLFVIVVLWHQYDTDVDSFIFILLVMKNLLSARSCTLVKPPAPLGLPQPVALQPVRV